MNPALPGRSHPLLTRLPGMLFAAFMTAFIFLALWFWIDHFPINPSVSLKQMQQNESAAFEALNRMISAQNTYRDQSLKFSDKASYAAFLNHLWIAVDPQGNPVRHNLIPEKLGVAVGPSKAVNGYYFLDVRQRHDAATVTTETIDYQKGWAIAAIPQMAGRTGSVVMIADQSGSIYGIPADNYSSRFPIAPAKAGWAKLKNAKDLAVFHDDRP